MPTAFSDCSAARLLAAKYPRSRRASEILSRALVRAQVASILSAWARRQGLPVEVILPPDHLARFAGLYEAPKLWPSLVGIQHDEKDIFRVLGPAGLQDWGDGEAQRFMHELKRAEDALNVVTSRWGGSHVCGVVTFQRASKPPADSACTGRATLGDEKGGVCAGCGWLFDR